MDIILDKIMQHLNNNETMDTDKYDTVRYGLEILLIKFTFSIAALIVSIIIGSFAECLAFMVFFSAIRCYAGGYHAKTRIACFILSMLTLIGTLLYLKAAAYTDFSSKLLCILALISFVVIWRLSPIDTENKVLDSIEKKEIGKKARVYLCVESALAGAASIAGFTGITLSIMLALVETAFLMIIEYTKKYRAKCTS